MTPQIESSGYDTGQFNDELVEFYRLEEQGQVGLPFAVFPAAVYYQKAMFDEAGLNYPPATYGEPYVMPDGTEVEWSFETLTELAKFLTVDANGNDATMEEFDPTQIVQYGYIPSISAGTSVGTFFGAGSMVAEDGTAQTPEPWKEAWQWWYDGMWGDEPFIPIDAVLQSPDYGAGNALNSGKVAMGLDPGLVHLLYPTLVTTGIWRLCPPTTVWSMVASMPTPIASGRARRIPMKPLKSSPISPVRRRSDCSRPMAACPHASKIFLHTSKP